MRFIDSKTHGILDYLSVVLFVASPWIFGFANEGTAMWIPVIIGVAVLLMSLMTDYELAAARIIPFTTHLTMDVIAGLFLIISPWVFDFADVVKWPHVALGVFAVGAGLFTRKNVRSPYIE
ncbi:SPW repeat protein [Algoriphagus resistens]|uniref:SPW repeat protein n=1 Tax=Algoriphagus resistens TaxID=1750590 RepID=UPI000716ABE8|nr:SPW repeat protein [Algoriphagus resistens]